MSTRSFKRCTQDTIWFKTHSLVHWMTHLQPTYFYRPSMWEGKSFHTFSTCVCPFELYLLNALNNNFGTTYLLYQYGHQGQCHFEVEVIPESNCKCLDFYHEAGGGDSNQCILVCIFTIYAPRCLYWFWRLTFTITTVWFD